jgi:hypothetical protein
MRSRRVRRILLSALVAATAGLAPVPRFGGESAQATTLTPQPIFSEDLGDGRILARFTHGLTVVATAGTEILFEMTPLTDDTGGLSVGLRPPDFTDAQVAAAASRYRASGRSPDKDLQALDYSQDQARSAAVTARAASEAGRFRGMAADGSKAGDIYDTGCAEIDGSVFWRGCFRRYRTDDNDPNAWYTADESQGTGHGKGAWYLRTGRTDHRYGRGEVVQWEPSNDIPAGKCRDVSFSLGAYGVSMSRTTTVCPEKISINVNNSRRFYAQWNGAVRADNPGVVAQDFTRVPHGAGSGFEYWVYEYHSVYS